MLGLSFALKPLTHAWPMPISMLVNVGLTIPVMTWVLMPALTDRLGPWLRR